MGATNMEYLNAMITNFNKIYPKITIEHDAQGGYDDIKEKLLTAIPANNTPFAKEKAGNVEMVLWLISLLRLRFPKALIPATTALATLCEDGTERGILAGANVVMPNITPRAFAANYTIYNNKKYHDSESATQLEYLEKRLNAIDRYIDYGRGDYII